MCLSILEDINPNGVKLKLLLEANYSLKEALQYIDCNSSDYDHANLCGVLEQVRPNLSVGNFNSKGD